MNIFFDASLRDKFVEHVKERCVASELLDDTMGLVIAVSEDLADDLVDSLEARYDELQD